MKKFLTFLLSAATAFGGTQAGNAGDFEFYKTEKLANKKIVFVSHLQYASDHHNSETMFQKGEFNENRWKLCSGKSSLVLAEFDAEGAVKNVEVPVYLPDGIVRDPSVSFDGGKIVFSMRKNFDDSFKLYEYDVATKKIRQLTFLEDVSDINPAYLPSGEIVFSSTRASKYCACNRHIMCNLYKCDKDGFNIVQIGNSIEFENGASVMEDGRILYTRWEYVDRNFSGAQGLWTCNSDGTRHALYWGQETNNAALDGVDLGGGRVLAVLGSCHDKPWGALAVIDRNIDVEGKHSVAKIFPEYAIKLVDIPDKWSDSMKNVKLKFQYPSVFDENTAAVSRQIAERSRQTILELVDLRTGAETVVAKSKSGLGLFNFKLVKPRKKPAVLPSQCDLSKSTAAVYVGNVYEGTHLNGVKKGDIKFLRVIENPPKINWTAGAWEAQGQQAPAMNYHDFDNKIVYGVVPVEEDGSAYFEIPSGKFVYLQALDGDMKMIQSMRSGLSAMPSEIVSCSGCHESRKSPPPVSQKGFSAALRKPPAKIKQFAHCGKLFSYAKQIQPIFDKHCVVCHDVGKRAGAKLVLAGDRGLVFNRSYTELHSKKYVNAIGAAGNAVVQANTWGAKYSPLVKAIDRKHKGIRLSDEEYKTLVAWIDLNAPYYDTDDSNFPDNPAGRSPISPAELAELEKLCGVKIAAKYAGNIINLAYYKNELVSFDRPETSPILQKLDKNSPEYTRALRIIKTGAERLKKSPRPDMEGFVPTQKAERLRARFNSLCELEKNARRAAENDEKLKDPDSLRQK